VPACSALQVGTDLSGRALGLHPNLTGLKSIFDAGRLAIVQRTGYADASRSHFKGTDILTTANPQVAQGTGWLGRYLDTLPSPVDLLSAWNTANLLPHALQASTVGVPSIPNPTAYAFSSPNTGIEAEYSAAAALATEVGTKIFWVQTGGYDTHASQGTLDGGYADLLSTLDGGLAAFYTDLSNQGLLNETMALQFSEFGRRVSENGSGGCDHGAGGLMMALGGGVQGGLYGTAATLDDTPDNPTLENAGRDVKHETDFRGVYARVIDDWLAANSVSILGGDFLNPSVDFV
jgi:uncharacterized protein (DUF1501 family)